HGLLQARVPIVECASFDDDALARHHQEIAHAASRHRVAAVVGAGWDPGLLPQLQRLFEQLIPKGRSHVSRHVAAAAHTRLRPRGHPVSRPRCAANCTRPAAASSATCTCN
ncbi:MAG TPA: hypothetical protein VLE45_12850, partial [Burkholderiaceae bacterium]|nr:hypothetical protein [Burkholderiaceae bacterium]